MGEVVYRWVPLWIWLLFSFSVCLSRFENLLLNLSFLLSPLPPLLIGLGLVDGMQDLKAMVNAAGNRPVIIVNPRLKVCNFSLIMFHLACHSVYPLHIFSIQQSIYVLRSHGIYATSWILILNHWVNHLQYDRVCRLHCGSQVMEAELRETQRLRSIQAESAGKHPPCWNHGLKINTVPV